MREFAVQGYNAKPHSSPWIVLGSLFFVQIKSGAGFYQCLSSSFPVSQANSAFSGKVTLLSLK